MAHARIMNSPNLDEHLHPQSVAALRTRLLLFTWGVRLAIAGALTSVMGSLVTQHPAGWPITLTGTALVALGLVLALVRLPSQAFYATLAGAHDAKGRHRCVACGDRSIQRPAKASGALWSRPRCRCARCGQFLFLE